MDGARLSDLYRAASAISHSKGQGRMSMRAVGVSLEIWKVILGDSSSTYDRT